MGDHCCLEVEKINPFSSVLLVVHATTVPGAGLSTKKNRTKQYNAYEGIPFP